jgi:hypothetical protein
LHADQLGVRALAATRCGVAADDRTLIRAPTLVRAVRWMRDDVREQPLDTDRESRLLMHFTRDAPFLVLVFLSTAAGENPCNDAVCKHAL